VDCAVRAGVHRSTWSRLERGDIGGFTLNTLAACLAVLEARVDLTPRWRGPQLDRLLDEAHARLQAMFADLLRRWGWDVRLEVSFNHYGDRGRVDLLAWHPELRILLIGEVKSQIVDGQELLGAMDVKVRLGGVIAAQLGLGRPAVVLPLLLLPDDPTVRRHVQRLDPLFAHFTLRGRPALTQLRRSDLGVLSQVAGLLVFSNRSYARAGSAKPLGTQRVRLRRPKSSVQLARNAAPVPPGPT
jgi:hypothetical protein